MTSYIMYRNTTVGQALQKTLDEFIDEGMIPQSLAMKVLATFDKTINRSLNTKIKNKMFFKAGKLRAYRFCDNVWTFLMEDVDFRDTNITAGQPIQRVKFVACDGSNKVNNQLANALP